MSRFPLSFRLAPAAFAAAAACLLAACASTGSPPALKRVAQLPSQPRAVVRMLPDRSLEVTTLVSRRGGPGGIRIVAPGSRDYDLLLARTGVVAPSHDAYPLPLR